MEFTQENLIEKVSKETRYSENTVREVLNGISKVVDDTLIFKPKQDITIRLWEGFKIERRYCKEKEYQNRGMFDTVTHKEKVKIKPSVTRNYKDKINKKIFN